MTWYASKATVYSLKQIKEFNLDADDLRELVEQLHPEWLNKPEAPSSNGEP